MDFTLTPVTISTGINPGVSWWSKQTVYDPDSDTLYYAHRGYLTDTASLYLSKSVDGGQTWQTPVLVYDYSAVPATAYKIAIDLNPVDKSVWIAVASSNASNYRTWDIHTNQSGSWVKTSIHDETGFSDTSALVDIVVTDDEYVHAIYAGKRLAADPIRRVWYKRFDGGSWSTAIDITGGAGVTTFWNGAINLVKAGNSLIGVWWGVVSGSTYGAQLIIRRGAWLSWDMNIIDDPAEFYQASVVYDPWDNSLHILAPDGTSTELYYGVWRSSTGFTGKTLLASHPSPDYIDYCHLAIDRFGNRFAAWVNIDDSDSGNAKVYYSIFDPELLQWSAPSALVDDSAGTYNDITHPFYRGDYSAHKPSIGWSIIVHDAVNTTSLFYQTSPYYGPGADPEVSAPGTIYSSVSGSFLIYQTAELESFASTFNIGYDEGFIFQESFDVLAEVFSSVSGDYDIWKIKEFWKNSNRSALTGRYNVRKLLIGPSASGIYNVRELNEVNSVVLGYYDIQSGIAAIESYANAARVWLDGVDITGKILSCRVSYSESDFTGTVDITFADWTMYHLVDPMDLTQFGRLRITVETLRQRVGFPDEWVNQGDFFLEKRSVSADYGSTVPTIWGRSRPALLSNPYASPYTRTWSVVTTAYEVAREVIDTIRSKHPAGSGIVFRWEIMDYAARAGKFAFSGVLPIDVLNAIAAPIGGVVSTNKEGDIIVKYKWDNVADIIARQEIL